MNSARHVNNERITALLTLLQDDDVKIASLAMEQFLKLGHQADETIAEHQESQDPQLRQRIHQLSTIVLRRRMREEFVSALSDGTLSLWRGIVGITVLYDPTSNVEYVERECDALADKIAKGDSGAAHVAKVMKDREVRVPSEEILDVDLYLIDRVLEAGSGSAVVLCALAQYAAGKHWPATLVLRNGRFCLLDADHTLVEPTEGWRITKLGEDERVHPCSIKDALLAVLTQLFLVSLVDGSLRELYHFGSLLTALNRTELSVLPYPLGEGDRPAKG
jgi:hypothetical protein